MPGVLSAPEFTPWRASARRRPPAAAAARGLNEICGRYDAIFSPVLAILAVLA